MLSIKNNNGAIHYVIISFSVGSRKLLFKLIFKNKNITYCYCISEYPLSFEKINWKNAVKYDGFSDHTMDILAPVLFSILKKQKFSKRIYIEKHVK